MLGKVSTSFGGTLLGLEGTGAKQFQAENTAQAKAQWPETAQPHQASAGLSICLVQNVTVSCSRKLH